MSEAVTREAMPARILDYLATKLPDAKALRLEHLERIAVGWSHETWLFDLCYDLDGATCRDGLCLRRDPGNALLRHLSNLKEQFRVLQCLDATPLLTPRPYWFEDDPGILVLVMEKVPGACPNPWGREGRKYYADAADRGVLPASFTDTLATLHTLDWRAAGLEFLGVPEGGTSFAHAEIAKWRELIAVSDRPPGADPHGPDRVAGGERPDHRPRLPGPRRLPHRQPAHRQRPRQRRARLGTPGARRPDVRRGVRAERPQLGKVRSCSRTSCLETRFSTRPQATGWAIDEQVCRYYEALYVMRSVALWMSAAGLFAEGWSDDLRLARTAWSVPVVLGRAGELLGY